MPASDRPRREANPDYGESRCGYAPLLAYRVRWTPTVFQLAQAIVFFNEQAKIEDEAAAMLAGFRAEARVSIAPSDETAAQILVDLSSGGSVEGVTDDESSDRSTSSRGKGKRRRDDKDTSDYNQGEQSPKKQRAGHA